jgi:hypothetical protein
MLNLMCLYLIIINIYYVNANQQKENLQPFKITDESLNDYIFIHPSHECIVKSSTMIKPPFEAIRYGKFRYYLIKDGKRYSFPDRYTFYTYGFPAETEKYILNRKIPFVGINDVNGYSNGGELPTEWNNKENIELLSYDNSNYLLDTNLYFNKLLNPNYIYWKGNIFVTWRLSAKIFRVIYINNANIKEYTNNNHILGFDIISDLNIINKHDLFNNLTLFPYVDYEGEDPKFFITNEDNLIKSKLLITYCHRGYPKESFGIPEIQMNSIEINININKIEINNHLQIHFYHERPNEDQKNWSPFEYNGKLLFISSPDPYHRIVETKSDNEAKSTSIVYAKTLALTRIKDNDKIQQPLPSPPTEQLSSEEAKDAILHPVFHPKWYWKFGQLRGGTQAIKINDHSYLTFFHSSRHPPKTGYVLKTYVMGAYIFSSKPPFEIQAITTEPITHRSMYQGKWSDLPESYYLMDYIIFPTSFIIRNDLIYLTYGRQDTEGWVATLSLSKLLLNMTSLTSTNEVDNNSIEIIKDYEGEFHKSFHHRKHGHKGIKSHREDRFNSLME